MEGESKMKKILLLTFVILLFVSTSQINSVSAAGKVYNAGGGWTYRVDTPDNAKPYHHIHFFKRGKSVFCLRLDNMKPCDKRTNDYSSFDKLPSKVKSHVTENGFVQKAVKKENPKTDSWVKKIPKWALVSVATLAVFLGTATFFFPGDDAVAWAFFLRAIAI